MTGPPGSGKLQSVLLECNRCGARYEVEDSDLVQPGVVVECETCRVPLAPVRDPAGPQPAAGAEAEATMMLAAFGADSLAQLASSGSGIGRSPAAPSRPARPSRPGSPGPDPGAAPSLEATTALPVLPDGPAPAYPPRAAPAPPPEATTAVPSMGGRIGVPPPQGMPFSLSQSKPPYAEEDATSLSTTAFDVDDDTLSGGGALEVPDPEHYVEPARYAPQAAPPPAGPRLEATTAVPSMANGLGAARAVWTRGGGADPAAGPIHAPTPGLLPSEPAREQPPAPGAVPGLLPPEPAGGEPGPPLEATTALPALGGYPSPAPLPPPPLRSPAAPPLPAPLHGDQGGELPKTCALQTDDLDAVIAARQSARSSPAAGAIGLMATEAVPSVSPGSAPPPPAPVPVPASAPTFGSPPMPAPAAMPEFSAEMPLPPPRGAPVGLLLGGVAAGLLLLAGTGFFAWKALGTDDGKAAGGAAPGLPFSSAISLLMSRSDAVLASVPDGEPPEESLPIVLTADALRIRGHKVLDLDDGRFEPADVKGLIVPSLLPPLMAERTAVGPAPDAAGAEGGSPQALGRGSDVLLVLAEASIPFKTIARLIYTAQSAGLTKLLLGGIAEGSGRKVVALPVGVIDWWPIAPGLPGLGLGVVADPGEGLVIFHREGKEIAEGGNRLGVSGLQADQLAEKLAAIKDRRPDTKLVTLQPDGQIQYDTLVALVAAARTEGLFERVIVGGGAVR